jgi:ribosomal protein S18 acetylase RimI-like enzyme
MVTPRPTTHTVTHAHATIRTMRPSDLDAVVQLDARVLGESRQPFFERRLASLDTDDPASHTIGLVAEHDGALAGFVMGTLASGEFGFTNVTALMDSIAIHPGQQRRGIGEQLANAFIAESAARGARDVYTLVNWKSWDLLKFFDSMQFGLAQTVLLHRKVGEIEREQP